MKSRLLLVFLGLVSAPCAAVADEAWKFDLTPYIWFAGLNGDVSTIPGAPVAPIDVSPKEAFEDTELGVMVMLNAKKGKNGIYTDFIYTDVRQNTPLVPPPINLGLNSTTKSTALTLAYQREVYRNESAVLDLLAGGRYWKIDSKLRFSGGLGPLAGQTVSHDESWVDPMIGLKGRLAFNGTNFYLIGGAGLGGFGIGSDLFYEWNASLGYQWTESIGTTIGYRSYNLDYDNDGFVYDVTQSGWQVGFTWSF